MSYTVELTPDAQADFLKLDNSQRLHVRKSLAKLENQGKLADEALHGKLAGYRKLKHRKLGLRVIFHETADGIEIIEVIAIGKRNDSEIYTIAEKRIREK
ncbi:type II toxin-antitoxin system mRNA interferase toxin, RelE/StbE family [Streptococcus anginosus]|uniref:type II toxin-antitoxin system RelE family toxin n=1 Tax=Streptococcus anginosus group TaxID=671232 RepID=UPI000D027677|nr:MULTISPECIES: type II toxin-antitoxin system mRNA interferase toxin, RelE/StbE family [Streptococcus anginosus group]MCW1036317.1 type II toxin-antitoxin system mRNA interferase toxin, RelE/StbE family [Streptococcus anginosus]PRT74589.1 addiction module toxin RelE [Streptococcus anginosus]QQC22629.1 type II toxin-antitoxin system mRNA interferase toxin, RelE/StbE family [Streptococcus constellatus]